MRALVVGAVFALTLSACGGDASRATRHYGAHDRVPVTFKTQRATGVSGRTIRNYTAAATAVHHQGGCVSDRDARFPDGQAGRQVRAMLDLARGEGGETGWCPGAYRGTVTYFEGFACPAKGACHPPEGFPTRTKVVARFAFVVG